MSGPEIPNNSRQRFLELYRDSARREAMGQRTRRYAEENYSKHAPIVRYNELLQAVAARKSIH